MACTEAPRGILYHRYHVDGDGVVREAKIVPPTSQNQSRIEQDLRLVLPRLLHLPDKEAARGLRASHSLLRSLYLLRNTFSESRDQARERYVKNDLLLLLHSDHRPRERHERR